MRGFPALLREMLWHANFTYAPKYTVYAQGVGPSLVDYLAIVDIRARIIKGGANPQYFEAIGTSEEMVVQAVTYKAMAALRDELPVLRE